MSKNLQDIYKIGDEVMVCNTDLFTEWKLCIVTGYCDEDGLWISHEGLDRYGGPWYTLRFVRKLTKLGFLEFTNPDTNRESKKKEFTRCVCQYFQRQNLIRRIKKKNKPNLKKYQSRTYLK